MMIRRRSRRQLSGPEAADSNPFNQLGALTTVEVDTTRNVGPGAHGSVQNPFGPFADPRDVGEQKRVAKERASTDDFYDSDYLAAVDCRGMADWSTVFRKDTSAYQWGLITIDCQAQASPTLQTTMDKSNFVEARILSYIGGAAFLVAIRAIGNHQDRIENASGGPMQHRFTVGEVPDRFEVQVRARQGGSAETTQNVDETLSVSIATRFRR
jgi:hypothetical protein